MSTCEKHQHHGRRQHRASGLLCRVSDDDTHTCKIAAVTLIEPKTGQGRYSAAISVSHSTTRVTAV